MKCKWNASEANRDVTIGCGFLISWLKSSSLYWKCAHGGGFTSFLLIKHARNSILDSLCKILGVVIDWIGCQVFSFVSLLCPSLKSKKVRSLVNAWAFFSFINFGWILSTNGLLWLKFKWISAVSCYVWSFYFLVTKVKGLSDLSEKAKISERAEPKRNRSSAANNERPSSTQGRQSSIKVGKRMRNLNYYRSLGFNEIQK